MRFSELWIVVLSVAACMAHAQEGPGSGHKADSRRRLL